MDADTPLCVYSHGENTSSILVGVTSLAMGCRQPAAFVGRLRFPHLRSFRVLPAARADLAPPLARSLLATVHGHCVFLLNGTFALLEEKHPREAALARVREALEAARA